MCRSVSSLLNLMFLQHGKTVPFTVNLKSFQSLLHFDNFSQGKNQSKLTRFFILNHHEIVNLRTECLIS